MSVGYITRRVWLSFNSCRPDGLHQPEVRYSTNSDHAGNSGQNRNTLARGDGPEGRYAAGAEKPVYRQVTELQDQRAAAAAGEEV
jgi:hypothetical protein